MKNLPSSMLVSISRTLIALTLLCSADSIRAEIIYGYVTSCTPSTTQYQEVLVTVVPAAAPSLTPGTVNYYVVYPSGDVETPFGSFTYQGGGVFVPATRQHLQAIASNDFSPHISTVEVWYPYRNPVHSFPIQPGGVLGSCTTNPPVIFTFPGNINNTVTITFGATPQTPPPNTKCNDDKSGGNQGDCSTCGGQSRCLTCSGMARYSVHSMLASLNIVDTPLQYSPPRGPAIDFTVTYNQRDNQQPAVFNYSNLGSKWTFNWLSYVKEDPTGSLPLTVYLRGGGAEIYTLQGSQTSAPDPQSHAILAKLGNGIYERRLPDGSTQLFNQTAAAAPGKIFMSQITDPSNNVVTIGYDPDPALASRLVKITDALGQITHIHYEDVAKPYRITRVTDPFVDPSGHAREAIFDYYPAGPVGSPNDLQLKTITDSVGIYSTFEYATSDHSISSLTTPYGRTTFETGINGTNRWIVITDPEGGKERVEYRDETSNIPSNDLLVPNITKISNERLNFGNTFYWDKKAMDVSPGIYTAAVIKHWLHNADGTVSGIMASEKKPLESRVWYTYDGQPDGEHVGTNASPSQIARVLDDGTSQVKRYEYNAIGKTTKSTDPLYRVMTYVYDSNQIDLLEVRQTTGTTNELIQEFQNYSLHKPRTQFDAARQPTYYEYNGFGQLLSIENAKQEITTYTYDRDDDEDRKTDGYLISITSPHVDSGSAMTSFEYDDYGRVKTVTLPDGYFVKTEYDFLDRKTKVTYPDFTFEAFTYEQAFTQGGPVVPILDLTESTDRLGLGRPPTVRHYNRNRQMVSMKDPAGQTTHYDWCTCGALIGIRDPKDNLTTFIRDLQSRLTSKVFASGSSIASSVTYSYENTTSRFLSMTDALNQTTHYQYYNDDNIKQVSYTNAQHPTSIVNYFYDDNYNRIKWVISGTGMLSYTYYPVTSFATLGAGRLQTIGGLFVNDTITYTYDELGRELGRTINGAAATVHYDPLGRVDATSNALGPFAYGYDGLTQRLESITNPNSQATSYHYFDLPQDPRLQDMESLSATSENLSRFDYTYDPAGQIKSQTKYLSAEGAAPLWFDYDPAKQLKHVHDEEDYDHSKYALDLSYDPAGNRTQDFTHQPVLENDEGVLHTFTANALNQIDSRDTSVNSIPSFPPAPLTYDANGNMTNDGAGKTYEWDAANRLAAINYIETGSRTEFAYDGLGRRVRLTEHGPGVRAMIQPKDSSYSEFTTAPFTLPAGDYRLTFTGVEKAGTAVALIDSVRLGGALVPEGSFENPDIGSGEILYNPIGASWRYSTHAGVAGNGSDLTNENPNAPEGDQVGFVENDGVIWQNWTAAAGTYTLSFRAAQSKSANKIDQRMLVTLRQSTAGVTTKTFVWCGSQICEERDGSGATVKKRFFAEGEQRIGGNDAGNYYYTRDHLGSIREVTNSGGDVLAQYDYDAYGNRVVLYGRIDVDFGYTGHYHHAPSGLNLTLYRAYDPTLGRWISRDPIDLVSRLEISAELLPEGPNLYRYVANNVINEVDRLGLKSGCPSLLYDCWSQPNKVLRWLGGPNAWNGGCLIAKETCDECCVDCFCTDPIGLCPRFCNTQYILCIRKGGGGDAQPPFAIPQPPHPPRIPNRG